MFVSSQLWLLSEERLSERFEILMTFWRLNMMLVWRFQYTPFIFGTVIWQSISSSSILFGKKQRSYSIKWNCWKIIKFKFILSECLFGISTYASSHEWDGFPRKLFVTKIYWLIVIFWCSLIINVFSTLSATIFMSHIYVWLISANSHRCKCPKIAVNPVKHISPNG